MNFSIPILPENYDSQMASIGDVYVFTYSFDDTNDWFGTKQYIIERLLESGDKFKVERDWFDDKSGLWNVQVKVIENPLPLIVVCGALFIGAGSVLWLIRANLVEVRKIIDVPAGKALAFAGAALAIAVSFFTLKKLIFKG
jgi:hypothetical protein